MHATKRRNERAAPIRIVPSLVTSTLLQSMPYPESWAERQPDHFDLPVGAPMARAEETRWKCSAVVVQARVDSPITARS
jgi:hypothetical protein